MRVSSNELFSTLKSLKWSLGWVRGNQVSSASRRHAYVADVRWLTTAAGKIAIVHANDAPGWHKA